MKQRLNMLEQLRLYLADVERTLLALRAEEIRDAGIFA